MEGGLESFADPPTIYRGSFFVSDDQVYGTEFNHFPHLIHIPGYINIAGMP